MLADLERVSPLEVYRVSSWPLAECPWSRQDHVFSSGVSFSPLAHQRLHHRRQPKQAYKIRKVRRKKRVNKNVDDIIRSVYEDYSGEIYFMTLRMSWNDLYLIQKRTHTYSAVIINYKEWVKICKYFHLEKYQATRDHTSEPSLLKSSINS